MSGTQALTIEFRSGKSTVSNSTFKALSSLIKTRPTTDHYAKFQEQAKAEKNDRGAAILFSANIENALADALIRTMAIESIDTLFGPEQPLGSFSSKISMGRAINLYGDETFKNLDCIRKIRNVFAHARIPVDFETTEIANACRVLRVPEIHPPIGISYYAAIDPDVVTKRELFTQVCNRLLHNLSTINFVGRLRIDRSVISASFDDTYTEVFALQEPLP